MIVGQVVKLTAYILCALAGTTGGRSANSRKVQMGDAKLTFENVWPSNNKSAEGSCLE